MTHILKYFRKAVRFGIAVVLWAHALFLLNIAPPSFTALASRIGLTDNEFVLLFLITGCTFLRFYGWANVFVDFLYIYCFPFVLPFTITWSVFTFARFVLSVATPKIPAQALVKTADQQKILTVEAPKKSEAAGEKSSEDKWKKNLRTLLDPFFSYTLLWGMLAALSVQPAVLRIATALVLLSTLRTVYVILKFGFISTDWISELETKIQSSAEKWILCIAAYNETCEPTAEVREAWNGLKALQLGIAVLKNKQIVLQWTIALGCVLFGVIYTYVAFLFSFCYAGISHIYGLHFAWGEAITTSLLLPVSFGDLPKLTLIRLLGGLQYLFILIAGVGSIFGYLKKKVETIQTAAAIVSLKLEQDHVSKTIVALDGKIGVAAAAKAAAASKQA